MNENLKTEILVDLLGLDVPLGSALTAGDPVSVGGTVGIARQDYAATANGTACVLGIVRGRKITGAMAVGLVVGFDNDGDPLGGTTGSGAWTGVAANCDFANVGMVITAAGATDRSVDILVCPWLKEASSRFTEIDGSLGNEIFKLTDTATAVNEITVQNAATANAPSIKATGTDTNVSLDIAAKGTGAINLGQATSTGVKLVADQPILDSAGLELVKFTATATAVNEVTVANAATGNAPSITASGETNVPLTIAAKGTGKINLGQATSTGVQLVADQPILDSAGLELIKFVATGTAVNEITVTNAATGNAPQIAATGETNVPLIVKAKGTGTLTLGQATGKVQVATAATDYVGLYDATPVVRANHITDPAGGATNDAEARTAINAILVALENLGVLKTS